MYYNKTFGIMFKTSYEHYIIDMITSGIPMNIKFHRMFDALSAYNQNKENDFMYRNKYLRMFDEISKTSVNGIEVNTDMKNADSLEFIIQQYYKFFSLY